MNHTGSAIVYNDFMRELGGGERSTLAYARALQQLGYRTQVLSVNPAPDREILTRHFGPEFAGVNVRSIDYKSAIAELQAPDLAVFVNHTFMSFIPNPAPIGIYAQMFPVRTLDARANAAELAAVASYDWVLCNSAFTLRYTRSRWGCPLAQLETLPPPAGDGCTELAASLLDRLPAKRRQIVHIGRFNPTAHCKNQDLIIETFLEAARQFPDLKQWRLVLMGTVTPDPVSRDYYARCVSLAGDRAVVLSNVPSTDLSAYLLESFGYVHATGAFLPSGVQPERCEHLGLSIVEAMAHACIPVVYGRGGIWDLVGERNGLLRYQTRSELVAAYRRLAELYETGAERLQTRNLTQAAALNSQTFRENLSHFLQEALQNGRVRKPFAVAGR